MVQRGRSCDRLTARSHTIAPRGRGRVADHARTGSKRRLLVQSRAIDTPAATGPISGGAPILSSRSAGFGQTRRLLATVFVIAMLVAGCDLPPQGPPPVARPPLDIHTDCPEGPPPPPVDIPEANPDVDPDHHDEMRQRLINAVKVANTTIRLGPNVVLDFTRTKTSEGDEGELFTSEEGVFLRFGPCVTLTSVTHFPPGEEPIPLAADVGAPEIPQARGPQSVGPLLRFGPHRDGARTFLEALCDAGPFPKFFADGVRISGLRIHGPDFGPQSTSEKGIRVQRCVNVEISNMEIAGFGAAGIEVKDDAGEDQGPPENPTNELGPRISHPAQVKVFRNYIHHNQHPGSAKSPLFFPSSALGYGVVASTGAWVEIRENVFDSNRHAIAAAGDTGGYDAVRNLVLKGGGVHGGEFLGIDFFGYTHQFDVHGTKSCRVLLFFKRDANCGDAGESFLYSQNAFQYRNGPAIKIRGRPLSEEFPTHITGNVFPHDSLAERVLMGDDAIHLQTTDNVNIASDNVVAFDAYGKYGVCDFDGDQIDDLFLPTGATWWYSSFGEFPWTYLNAASERLGTLRLGYFDDDLRCDVLAESGGEWVISSGGTGAWTSIGAFGVPLSEVVFGRFDPSARDHRPGATKRTTHAFHRAPGGQWSVTPLTAPDGWQVVGGSSFPMSRLRFGDFTGDGVTDVLAVERGRWAISDSARGEWRRLNPDLRDAVASLFIADLNNNNIDDLIKLERKVRGSWFAARVEITWWVSDDGRSRWRKLKSYSFSRNDILANPGLFGFVGRFGAAPGGGVLLTDTERIGHFFSEAEIGTGAPPDWSSLFAY